MRIPALLIAAVFGAVTVTLWGLANQPVAEPEWPQRIQGFAFSPYRTGQDAVAGDFPDLKQIEDDLVLLKDRTRSIRTYTTDGTIGEVPILAESTRSRSRWAPGSTRDMRTTRPKSSAQSGWHAVTRMSFA